MAAPNYGSITLDGNSWVIAGEPFVRARLKRLFPRLPQLAGATLRLSATAENSRELAWFVERYPMTVDRPEFMERLARQHIEDELRLAELLAGTIAPIDVSLAHPAREYQLFAAQMLHLRKKLLLADDVGLGKTVSAICAMLHGSARPVLVVCPAHVTRQWAAMIKRFAPGMTTHILKKGKPYDLTPKSRKGSKAQLQLIQPSFPDVIIGSYFMIRGWAEHLSGVVRMVVYDECQALRHPGTGIYAAAKTVGAGAEFTLGLSATPIHNYGNEFHHVINVVVPDSLGEYGEFIREWCTTDSSGKEKINDTKQFGAYLRREGIMLRRDKKEVGRELPRLSKIIHEIEADEKAIEEMQGNAIALAQAILRHNEQFKGERMQASGRFDNLMRQATGVAKAPYVVEFVRMLLGNGEPIVLFGWHRAVYSIWMEGLAEFNPVLYTGTESPSQKAEAVEAFTSGKSKVLIMSLRSGAGVDGLQYASSTVVFGELDWSPSVHEQCIGRVDRDGQDTPCSAYFLLSEAGADPIMAEVLGVKHEQIEGVRNPDAALIERIDTGENNLRRLARAYLELKGEALPDEQLSDSSTPQSEPEPVA